MGYEVQPSQFMLFERYRDELLKWNQRTNLTAITDPAEIETRHFLDSVTVLYLLREQAEADSGLSLIDIGTGAGFPGIPVKLVLPHLQLVLLEATGKKVQFLRHMVDALALSDTIVIHGRAEDVAHVQGFRERFDAAVARAVAPLSTLAEICLPFVRDGGLFVALKKGPIDVEVASARTALAQLGGDELHILDVPLRQLPDRRHLVWSAKTHASPDGYPRRAGVPFKRPL